MSSHAASDGAPSSWRSLGQSTTPTSLSTSGDDSAGSRSQDANASTSAQSPYSPPGMPSPGPRRFSTASSAASQTPTRPFTRGRRAGSSSNAYSHTPRRSIAHGPRALGDASLLLDRGEDPEDDDFGSWDDVSLDVEAVAEPRRGKVNLLRFLTGARQENPDRIPLGAAGRLQTQGSLSTYQSGLGEPAAATAMLAASPSRAEGDDDSREERSDARYGIRPAVKQTQAGLGDLDDGDDDEDNLPSFGLGPHERIAQELHTAGRATGTEDTTLFMNDSSNPFEQRQSLQSSGAMRSSAYGYEYGAAEEEDHYETTEDAALHPNGKGYPGRRRHLQFEALTTKEKMSYWTTLVLVIALSLVAIGIGVDWIDWPGDGLGKY